MFAVQADGADIMTIEGLAKDGKLPPHPGRASGRSIGLQCGFCTPGMIMTRPTSSSSGNEAERDRDPPLPRGQPLSLHRVPQHRQGDPVRGGEDGHRTGRRGHGTGEALRLEHQAARGPPDDHRRGASTPTTSSCLVRRTRRSSGAPTPTRVCGGWISPGPSACRGGGGVHRPGHGGGRRGPAAVRLAASRHQDPRVPRGRHGQGQLRGARGGGRHRRERPTPPGTAPSRSSSTTTCCPR